MHAISFLQELAVVLSVAGLVTIVFHRFKQPVVLGYIVAGVIIGPYTPPLQLIHDREAIDTLAEVGVILLMFGLGLEFRLRKPRHPAEHNQSDQSRPGRRTPGGRRDSVARHAPATRFGAGGVGFCGGMSCKYWRRWLWLRKLGPEELKLGKVLAADLSDPCR